MPTPPSPCVDQHLVISCTDSLDSYPACQTEDDKLLGKPARVFEPSVPELLSDRARVKGTVLHNIESRALLNAPVCPYVYDLYMFSPPAGGQRQVYTEVASQIASLGFLVVTVDHPALSGAVNMSDGSLLYNTPGGVIDPGEAELLQVANLQAMLSTLTADEPLKNSSLGAQKFTVNTACISGHGLGGRATIRLMDNRMVSCGRVLDNSLPMPAPFDKEDFFMPSMPPQHSAPFAPGGDEADLGTIQPAPTGVINETSTRSPVVAKIVGIAQGVTDFAATGISKLARRIANRRDTDNIPENDEDMDDDFGLSSHPPYDKPHYDYGYEDLYNPQPDGSDDHYEAPPPPPVPTVWPPPGVFPPGSTPPPPPPPPPSNNTNQDNGTSPPPHGPQVPSFPPPPEVPSLPPPQVPSLPPPRVPSIPPPYIPGPPPYVPGHPHPDCGPDRHDHEGPEPCPVVPEPPCSNEPEHPCPPNHGDFGKPVKGDDKQWEYDWGNCDDQKNKDKKGKGQEDGNTEEDDDEEKDQESEDMDENDDGEDGEDHEEDGEEDSDVGEQEEHDDDEEGGDDGVSEDDGDDEEEV